MNVGYRVTLTQYERDELGTLLSGGRQAARKLKRAQILLAADAGVGDEEIAASVGVGGSTVYRTKRRFVEGNLERALSEEFARPIGNAGEFDRQGGGPAGSDRLRKPAGGPRPMDAGPARRRDGQADCARESGARAVRRRFADADLKPWRRKMWCIPQVDADYVARMEDVLDLYAERRPDPQRPVVCFDESPIQLIGEVRRPIPPEPGQVERYDCEYRRNGTANLFVFLDANRPWRKVKVTARRTAIEFAVCMRELADLHYPKAERIRVVLDNLSTHSAGAFYQAFPAEAGAAPASPHRVPLRSQARQLAQHGRDRDRRPRRPMPGPSHRKLSAPHRRSRRLGEPAQCRPRPHRLELHNRKGPHQNGASLSEAHKPKTAAKKSKPLCRGTSAAIGTFQSKSDRATHDFSRLTSIIFSAGNHNCLFHLSVFHRPRWGRSSTRRSVVESGKECAIQRPRRAAR